MPEIAFRKGSTSKSVRLRFITIETATPAEGVNETTPGLELWYERDGGARVDITPVALSSLLSPYTPGGIEPVGAGYTRVDVPDAALDFGADTVLVSGSATGVLAIGVTVILKGSVASDDLDDTTDSPGQSVECDVLLPEAPDATHDGCPVVAKRRHIPIPKGLCGTAVWKMRLPNGLPANFADCITGDSLSEDGSVTSSAGESIKVRFMGCDRGAVLAEVAGEIIDATTGLIQFPIPRVVCRYAGIYQFFPALVRDGSPIFMDKGLISVEHSAWGNTADMSGPPTIEEIRFAVKDRAVENDLLGAVEYDDAEILEAIRWPVMQFNEKPPSLSTRYNCNNFPFRYHWVQAIVYRLLTMAAHHYVRNKLLEQGGGTAVDPKNKDGDYLRFGQIYAQEWNEFLIQKKVELNAQGAWGTIGFDCYY